MEKDVAIAEAAQQALTRNSAWTHRVWLAVDRGDVTLLGELESEHERQNLEDAIRSVPGVVGVCNLITLSLGSMTIDVDGSVQSSM